MHLIPPTLEYAEQYRTLLEEFRAHDIHGFWELFGPFEDAASFVEKMRLYEHRTTAPVHLVPASVFWLIDNGELVGHTSIRHELNDDLRRVGGHIGFHIRPSKHGKGYGTEILRLALLEAKKLGLNRVLVTCDVENIASKRVIEKNGGVFHGEFPYAHGKLLQFWIENR